MNYVTALTVLALLQGCGASGGASSDAAAPAVAPKTEEKVATPAETAAPAPQARTMARTAAVTTAAPTPDTSALKLTATNCVDPDLTLVLKTVSMTLCNGTTGHGTMNLDALTAANVRLGAVVGSVTGTYGGAGGPADCTLNGQVGCVTTLVLQSADATNLTIGNIKIGVTVGGVTGTFPSDAFPLDGGTMAPDLDSAALDARIKSGSTFQWWDHAGNHYSATGNANITAANIKSGVTIFGVTGTYTGTTTTVEPAPKDLRLGTVVGTKTGTLKVNCRNAGNLSMMDNPYPATNNGGTAGGNSNNNTWDTLDDYFNGGVGSDINSAWTSDMLCRGTELRQLTTEGITDSTNWTGLEDPTTGLWWAFGHNTSDWKDGVNSCVTLNVNGVTGWRMPTQKELMTFYIHGSRAYTAGRASLDVAGFPTGSGSHVAWAATSDSLDMSKAWTMDLWTGTTASRTKTTLATYVTLCVK
jgi:hypothetical protein